MSGKALEFRPMGQRSVSDRQPPKIEGGPSQDSLHSSFFRNNARRGYQL